MMMMSTTTTTTTMMMVMNDCRIHICFRRTLAAMRLFSNQLLNLCSLLLIAARSAAFAVTTSASLLSCSVNLNSRPLTWRNQTLLTKVLRRLASRQCRHVLHQERVASVARHSCGLDFTRCGELSQQGVLCRMPGTTWHREKCATALVLHRSYDRRHRLSEVTANSKKTWTFSDFWRLHITVNCIRHQPIIEWAAKKLTVTLTTDHCFMSELTGWLPRP